jgi:O-antigen/teichoic acid export membrane protein
VSQGLRGQLRRLAGHSALYGSADVLGNVVNMLLTPVYTVFLGPVDYGNLQLLALLTTAAKIVFRLGLDAAFFRLYYDLDAARRRRLVGSVAVFAGLVAAVLYAVLVLAAAPLAGVLLGDPARAGWVRLALADVFFGSFAFVPLNLLRIQDRPALFSAYSLGRHLLNTVLKVTLLMLGLGVTGVLWSDALATLALSAALVIRLRGAGAWALEGSLLRESLGFGLPKVPHAFFVQIQNLADRKILDLFLSRADVGIYGVAYTLGSGVKFALSAFAPAWEPFVYAQLARGDAPRTLARVATYAWAVFLAAGLGVAVFGRELLMLLTPRRPAFWPGWPVIPVVTLAYLFHGAFLLTGVGIGIRKRTRYLPLITAAAAATNVGANLVLIPRFGMLGAAWATVLSYAVMAGLGFRISHSLYPVPWEWGRLGRLSGAAAAAYGLALLAPQALVPALAAKAAAWLAYPAATLALGVLRPEERAWLQRRLRPRA